MTILFSKVRTKKMKSQEKKSYPKGNASIRFPAKVLLISLFLIFRSAIASAQTELPDSVVQVRINFIQNMLNQGKPAANLWWNGWLYGYSAATVVQGVIFIQSNVLKTRQDMALGAATTLIGAVGQVIAPMVPGHAPVALTLLPGDTPEERTVKLRKAEELFAASAKREADGRSWKFHAASGAVNLGSGLVTWLGFDRTFKAGLINFAINTAITEAQIWSQPTRAIKDYHTYCEKYKYGPAYSSYKPKARLLVNAYPGGLALRLMF
jgi:hypothetical protein